MSGFRDFLNSMKPQRARLKISGCVVEVSLQLCDTVGALPRINVDLH